jgi:hypothetical protein
MRKALSSSEHKFLYETNVLLFPLYLAYFYSYPSVIFLAQHGGTVYFIGELCTTVLQRVVSCRYGVQSVLWRCLPQQ